MSFLSAKRSPSFVFPHLQIPHSGVCVVYGKVHASILAPLIPCSTLNTRAASVHSFSPPQRLILFSLQLFLLLSLSPQDSLGSLE